jgi:hypothetical protein
MEEDCRSSLNFKSALLRRVEAIAFSSKVVFFRLVMLSRRKQIAVSMTSRNDLQASICDSGIIQRDPDSNKTAIPSRYRSLILMPRVSGKPRWLDEQLRLKAFDVRSDQV